MIQLQSASYTSFSISFLEFQAIAKMTGKLLQLVLQEELTKLNLSTATSAQIVLSQSGNDEVGHAPDLGSVLTSPRTTQLSGAAPIATGNPLPTVSLSHIRENLNKRATNSQITKYCQFIRI